jgi:hypothetical protein
MDEIQGAINGIEVPYLNALVSCANSNAGKPALKERCYVQDLLTTSNPGRRDYPEAILASICYVSGTDSGHILKDLPLCKDAAEILDTLLHFHIQGCVWCCWLHLPSVMKTLGTSHKRIAQEY